jgi:hypothetical protein
MERFDFRAPPEWFAELDAWRRAQPGGLTRSQALRYLVDQKLRDLKSAKKK